MKWDFGFDMIATAITDLIHKVGEVIEIIIGTITLSF